MLVKDLKDPSITLLIKATVMGQQVHILPETRIERKEE